MSKSHLAKSTLTHFSFCLRQKMYTYKPEYTNITLQKRPRMALMYVLPLYLICWEPVDNTAAYEQWAVWQAEALLGDGYWDASHGSRSLFARLLMSWHPWISTSVRWQRVAGAGCFFLFTCPAAHVEEVCQQPSQKYRPATEIITICCRSYLKSENLVSSDVISTTRETMKF